MYVVGESGLKPIYYGLSSVTVLSVTRVTFAKPAMSRLVGMPQKSGISLMSRKIIGDASAGLAPRACSRCGFIEPANGAASDTKLARDAIDAPALRTKFSHALLYRAINFRPANRF